MAWNLSAPGRAARGGKAGLTAGGSSPPEEDRTSENWITLLDDPAVVFARRLEAEGEGLTADEDRVALTDGFPANCANCTPNASAARPPPPCRRLPRRP